MIELLPYNPRTDAPGTMANCEAEASRIRWPYAVFGGMLGFLLGFIAGVGAVSPRTERTMYVGDFLEAKDINQVAADLGCPDIDAHNGEALSRPLRNIIRCIARDAELRNR